MSTEIERLAHAISCDAPHVGLEHVDWPDILDAREIVAVVLAELRKQPPPAPTPIKTCLVCAQNRRGETHFPETLPAVVWMCARHWDIYLASALGPQDQGLGAEVKLILGGNLQ